eukprot:Nitzschia sp. Nitz4//scaffold109_size72162//16678//17217//NITZ4_005837-RA/size72162-snap-gene-0.94-mRNA-1//1//CDS//3329532736//6195//frame0
MLSEVSNALFLTYLASEYGNDYQGGHESTQRQRILVLGLSVFLVNVLDRVSGAQEIANTFLRQCLHLPRIFFVAVAFFGGLYVDLTRQQHRHAGLEMSLWEHLHLPMEWLNGPIYYGTLYGPFAWVYIYVKRQVLAEATSLPL